MLLESGLTSDERAEEKRYEGLGPFEPTNKLTAMSQEHHERLILKAGRGNSNWLAEDSRQGYFQFGFFTLSEAKRVWHQPGFSGSPVSDGVGARHAGLDFDALVLRWSMAS
ncbi:MAG: aspartate 4-decarboxylase [Paracoccaceae bacterium]|jgi:aspartate 4-decarboxylase